MIGAGGRTALGSRVGSQAKFVNHSRGNPKKHAAGKFIRIGFPGRSGGSARRSRRARPQGVSVVRLGDDVLFQIVARSDEVMTAGARRRAYAGALIVIRPRKYDCGRDDLSAARPIESFF